MDTTKRPRGRPQKISNEDKIKIVDLYWFEVAGNDPNKLRIHNIYAEIARYANNKGYGVKCGKELKATDFRVPEIKAIIQKYADTSSFTQQPADAYAPLDIAELMTKPIAKQMEILSNRELEHEARYRRAVVAISTDRTLRDELFRYAEKQKSDAEKINDLTVMVANLQKEIARKTANENYLKKIIKEHIEPKQAEEYFKNAPSLGYDDSLAFKITDFNYQKAIRDDKAKKKNATQEATLDWNELCDFDS